MIDAMMMMCLGAQWVAEEEGTAAGRGEKRGDRRPTMVHEVALATKMIVRMLGDAGDKAFFLLSQRNKY